MATDPHDEIQGVFKSFQTALAAKDGPAFDALCVEDEVPQTDLFLENAESLAEAGLLLRITRIDQEGEVAEVAFDVVEGDNPIDEGVLTMTLEAQGWRIRSL